MLLSFCFSYATLKDATKEKDLLPNHSFVGLEIAHLVFQDTEDFGKNDGVSVELLFTPKELNSMFNAFAKKYNLEHSNYTQTKIVIIDGIPYLRSYSSDGYVTTTGLEPKYSQDNKNIVLIVQGINCTSILDAQNYGCLPEGTNKCTPCPNADCTKTVTMEDA